jgi:predicted alpha/beta-fold hydrolase
MPIISSDYHAPFYLFNGHLETIIPSMFRKVRGIHFERERLELPDEDFLDLDWIKTGSDKVAIISHGLEGSSERHYSKGMARYFSMHGWDALAWNCRSCSGELNRLPRFYHHGDALDLKTLVDHTISKNYMTVVLIGFSMGGSMTLKYLGEYSSSLPEVVKAGVTFSVPCDLMSSVKELNKVSKSFYRNRFLKKLSKKIEAKSKVFPALISHQGFDKIKTFEDFDNRYTAPLHGFKDAHDFYTRASCKNYLSNIRVPALIVNAENDPFLTGPCYPKEIAMHHQYVHLEIPTKGGHVGFSLSNSETNWMEVRALTFINEIL